MTKFTLTAVLFLAYSITACEGYVPHEPHQQITSRNQETNTPPENLLNNNDTNSQTTVWPKFDWTHKHPDFLKWNQQTFDSIEEIGKNLTLTRPDDIISFCPNYDQLNATGKKMFWVSLIAAMARYESSFKPETSYVESFKDNSGQNVVSRGLLQLSIESSLAYKCPLSSATELHRADKNLDCAIRIMDRWVHRDGVIADKVSGNWRGGARYWSVLRKEKTLSFIKVKTTSNEVCQ